MGVRFLPNTRIEVNRLGVRAADKVIILLPFCFHMVASSIASLTVDQEYGPVILARQIISAVCPASLVAIFVTVS